MNLLPYLHFIISTTHDFTLHLVSRVDIILQANIFLIIKIWMWIGYKFNLSLITVIFFWLEHVLINWFHKHCEQCFKYVDNQGWIFGVACVCKDPFLLKYE
jgi:hypothetical protein